jgi:hypothetical protein
MHSETVCAAHGADVYTELSADQGESIISLPLLHT